MSIRTSIFIRIAVAAAVLCVVARGAEQVRVMSFNIWVGGESGKQPLSQTLKVIQTAKADIIGLQEQNGGEENGVRRNNGRKLAEMLGWHYFDQGEGMGIISRFPIVTNTPRKWGVAVRLPSGKQAWMFNAHLNHAPYQPYQLLKIPYANAPFITTATQAVDEARKARGAQVDRLVSELKPALAKDEAVFLTGDFNEPSHQDWTKRAAETGKCPLAVEYPNTLVVTQTGMRDAFRTHFPDEVAYPGWTWTPTTSPDDPKDRHDRIDFIFASPNVTVKNCEIVGEDSRWANLVITPYPSDHRSVVATLELP